MVVITKKEQRDIKRLEKILSLYGINLEQLSKIAYMDDLSSLKDEIKKLREEIRDIKANSKNTNEEDKEIEEAKKFIFEKEEVR